MPPRLPERQATAACRPCLTCHREFQPAGTPLQHRLRRLAMTRKTPAAGQEILRTPPSHHLHWRQPSHRDGRESLPVAYVAPSHSSSRRTDAH